MSKFVNYINEDVLRALLHMVSMLFAEKFGAEEYEKVRKKYLTDEEVTKK